MTMINCMQFYINATHDLRKEIRYCTVQVFFYEKLRILPSTENCLGLSDFEYSGFLRVS